MNEHNDLTGTMVSIRDHTGNPAPLGLLAFGMTTVLLNLHNAGYFTLGSVILSMGIFYGGIAQVIAGWMEWKRGNTFACTAFVSFGLFWISLIFILILPGVGIGETNSPVELAAYLLIWGLLVAGLFIGTLKFNRAMQVIFASVVVLFVLLAIGTLTGSVLITRIAGYEGIFAGFCAIYTGLALVINETYGEGKMIVPLWPIK